MAVSTLASSKTAGLKAKVPSSSVMGPTTAVISKTTKLNLRTASTNQHKSITGEGSNTAHLTEKVYSREWERIGNMFMTDGLRMVQELREH